MSTTDAGDHRASGGDPGKHQDLIPREFLRVLAVWSIIPLYAIAGAFLGWLFDTWRGTSPYGVGLGLILALIFAVRDVMRLRDEF